MANRIALIYIGARRFEDVTRQRHDILAKRLHSRYGCDVHWFTHENERLQRDQHPYPEAGAMQVTDFCKARDILDGQYDILIKMRTDLWITDTAWPVLFEEVDRVVDGETDIGYVGYNFLEHYDKVLSRKNADDVKKVQDFIVIANKDAIATTPELFARLGKNDWKKRINGNKIWRYIRKPETSAETVSTQIYLIREQRDEYTNWQLLWDWFSKKKDAPAHSMKWLEEEQTTINRF
jgi:hypothetical protein